jgi:hypothetical protein
LDKSTAEAIRYFDINHLPKLHREETARDRYLMKTAEGLRMSLDNGKVELLTTRTKLQSAFRDLLSFLSAWQVYVTIRSQYHPERGSGLMSWTKRLIYHAQIHPWYAVLNYAIAYFQKHQRDPPEYWFQSDSDLIVDTIMSIPSRPATTTSPARSTTIKKARNGYLGYLSKLESIVMCGIGIEWRGLYPTSCVQ